MIKFIVVSIVILALVGGVVQLKVTDKDYSLVVNKEIAKVSVYNGAIKVYDFVKDIVSSAASEVSDKVK